MLRWHVCSFVGLLICLGRCAEGRRSPCRGSMLYVRTLYIEAERSRRPSSDVRALARYLASYIANAS